MSPHLRNCYYLTPPHQLVSCYTLFPKPCSTGRHVRFAFAWLSSSTGGAFTFLVSCYAHSTETMVGHTEGA